MADRINNNIFAIVQSTVSGLSKDSNTNVTLDDEFHGKDFISHKQKFFDQFGTKIDIVPLS